MNCSNIRPLLSAYYDGDATPAERAQVEKHLESCADCRRVLAEFRAIGSDVRGLPMPKPPATLRRDVWRAIEAQQTSSRLFRGAPGRGVAVTLPQPKERSIVPPFIRGVGRTWAAALPAALLIGGLLLVLSVIMLRNSTPSPVAAMVETEEITAFTQPVHVRFSTEVNTQDAVSYTYVREIMGGVPITLTDQVAITWDETNKRIAIQPRLSWTPGTKYEVYVDAPRIGLIIADGKLDSKPITLSFSVALNTPTPTVTPTITPTPTETPVPPTNTPQPTAVAENSPVPTQGQVGAPTSEPTQEPVQPSPTTGPKASPTIRVNPSNTASVPPTNTPVQPTQTSGVEPTRTVAPTQTPVATATPRATQPPVPTSTATPRRGTPTATATPRVSATPTSTPTGPCDLLPVRGFGKVWLNNQAVRNHIGCPEALEMAIPEAVVQHFQGGMMFWRADLKLIYVFIDATGGESGTWLQFNDTWQDTDIVPKLTATATPPPNGLYEPVRGFGKLWSTNGYLRQALGWGIEQERAVTGAWQKFERGEALWTSDLDIRFMYDDGTFQRFDDTFTAPGEQEQMYRE